MSEPATVTDVLKIGSELYTIAKKQGWLEKLAAFLKTKRYILILGASGAGKSQFLASLNTLLPELILNTDRTSFPVERTLNIGHELFRFVDPPGAEADESKRKRAVFDALKGDCDGVINVVSYGYHEYNVGSAVAVDAKNRVYKEFLEAHRKLEIDQLDEWTSLLGGDAKRWLMTVVSKADLWWDQRADVQEYYGKGAYSQALGEAARMQTAICQYSSIRHRFYGAAPTSGYFDDAERLRLREHFFDTLFAAIGKPR